MTGTHLGLFRKSLHVARGPETPRARHSSEDACHRQGRKINPWVPQWDGEEESSEVSNKWVTANGNYTAFTFMNLKFTVVNNILFIWGSMPPWPAIQTYETSPKNPRMVVWNLLFSSGFHFINFTYFFHKGFVWTEHPRPSLAHFIDKQTCGERQLRRDSSGLFRNSVFSHSSRLFS